MPKKVHKPIVIPKDRTSSWVLIIISIVLILIFWVWIIYLIRTNPVTGTPLIQCSPGQCATDLATGIKDCPSSPSEIKTIDPTTQTCNSPFTCESSQTPYALQSDGSTNNDGLCQSGVQCRCLTNVQCGYHVTAYFEAQGGDAFQSIAPQLIVFQQNTSTTLTQGETTTFQNLPPYVLTSPTTQFCAIPNEWLSRTWPNTGSQTNLGGCVVGTMAYVPENPQDFTSNDLDTTPLSCVQGNPCPQGQVAYWNNNINQVNCLPLNS